MVLYVTDTHPLVWYATRQYRKLSKRAFRIFQEAASARTLVYVPAVVLWEISVLLRRDRIRLPEPLESWARRLLAQGGFDFAPFDLPMIAEASRLTFTHDPFDSAIVATARLKDLPLITKDQQVISARVVEVAW